MNTLRIAVGSTRGPKLNAVREAAALFASFFENGIAFEIEGYEVESGVSHTPTSREELMLGARQRAEMLQQRLRSANCPTDFCVGVEGGLDIVRESRHERVFFQSWAYACDRKRGYFGCGGSIELPAVLMEKVLSKGAELAAAIDEFAGAVGIRDGKGAWGSLEQSDLAARFVPHRGDSRVRSVLQFANVSNSFGRSGMMRNRLRRVILCLAARREETTWTS